MIDSPSNPTVKLLRSLEQAKARREHALFLVEGVRAVEDGLSAGSRPTVLIYNADMLRRTERGSRLLRRILSRPPGKEPRPEPLEATPRAIEAAATTQHPQGVVAAFRVIEWPSPSAPETGSPLILVCDNIQDPGNLGTILRTAEAAGVTAVWLSPQCADHYNPKVVRAAMGAHFRLPIFSADWQGIEQGLEQSGVARKRIFATEAEAEAPYDSVRWIQPSALVVSNEAHGASKEAVGLAGGGAVTIPMAGGTESLNAATAAAVVLFEAARQRRTAGGGRRRTNDE